MNYFFETVFKPFSANFTKWSNTLKQFVGNLPKNCLSVFDHYVALAFKGLSLNDVIRWLSLLSLNKGSPPNSVLIITH